MQIAAISHHSPVPAGPRRARLPASHVALCVGLLCAATATPTLCLAQAGGATAPAAAVAPPPAPTFAVRGFTIKGHNPLPEGETSALLAPFLRTQATLQTLADAAAALESALKAQGWGLYKVVLPPQALGETVMLEIVTFTIGKVDVKGQKRVDTDNVLASLPELAPGHSPNLRRLAGQTRLANTSTHKQLRVGLRESATPDRIDASIEVRDTRPWQLGVDISNAGTAATGRDRVTLLASHGNLFNRDHNLSGAWTTSVEQPNDVRQWGLSYRVPLYAQAGALSASLSRSDVVGRFGAFSSTGAGDTFQAGYTQQLAPVGERTSEWSANLVDRLFKGAQLYDSSGAPVGPATPDTRSRSLNLGYSAATQGDARSLSYHVTWAVSLPGGRGNNLAAYSNNGLNTAITSAHWQALRGSANLQQTLPAKWQLVLRGDWQYSADALISGEQFGLGGASSVRGLAERALQGDKGLLTSIELQSPELQPHLRVLGFVDAGWLGNQHPNATRLGSDRVSSVGLGLRWASGPNASLGLDYGHVMVGSRQTTPDAPRRGDDRLHLSLSLRY